jgi:Glycosyl transferases group 1/Glycosyltransferase Family 4
LPKTLHIDTGREMRGGQWQVLYLLRGLAAQGHQATLLARPGSALLDRARTEDVDARPLHLRDLLRLAPSFDLVHAHDARSHTLASLLSTPLVVSRRVAFPLRRSILSRWKYSRPARYIAVSNYVKRILVEAGLPGDRIEVVNDGVPLPPDPRYGNRTRVIAIDSGDPGKGKALILEAARRAKIGVLFSKNLADDLASAAIFVYISDLEGLGSAALLAMAAGVPVLASGVGGLPEIVEDGATGLLTENTPEQISDKMLVMTRDPAALERWGRNARGHIENGFTTEHMTRNTLQVYEKVLG